jgi:Carbohydrate phosphorylase
MVQIPTEDSTATTKLTIDAADDVVDVRTGLQADALQQAITDHLRYSMGRHASVLTPAHYYRALALALRDRVQQRWIASTQTFLDLSRKVVCYLSAEFLMGPQLGNNLLNLQIEEEARAALAMLGQDLDTVLASEEEPGLGNGGLGRLAACYLDSLATLERPAIGYGIRYEFGIFDQEIHHGWQVEKPDNWLANGNPWEISTPDLSYQVNWGGRTEHYVDEAGDDRARWVPRRVFKGVPYHTPLQGYGREHVQHAEVVERERSSRLSSTSSTPATIGRRSRMKSPPRPSPRCSIRTTNRRSASGFACCSSTSSSPARCRISSTSWRTSRIFPSKRSPRSSRYSSMTRIRRSASPS